MVAFHHNQEGEPVQTKKTTIIILTPARDLKKLANTMACCKTGPAPTGTTDE